MFSFDADLGEIRIYDEIGPAWWGLIDADMVIDALGKMEGKHATIRINTPGGSVDEGIAIYNAMKRHKGGVTTIVDSLAASMGSYLLQAGDKRIAASNAMVMIHDPWTIAYGNAAELRKNADVLDKYAARMLPDYAARSGKTEEEVIAIMAEESWYAGQEIVDAGWADEIGSESDEEPVTAGLHRMAKHAPASLFQKREKVKQVLEHGLYARRDAAKAAQLKVAASVKML
jgi:ATP-dependent Clp protease protease subunit